MWLCIISRRPFEDTCESALWRKVQRFNQCSERFHIVSHLTIWRSRRDVAHWLTYSLTHWTLAATWLMGLWWLKMKVVNWWKLFIDESCQLMKVVNWWKLSVDVSCLLMKVVYWWKLSIDESCWWKFFVVGSLFMEVDYWWKLSSDESCLLMKVMYWWKLK